MMPAVNAAARVGDPVDAIDTPALVVDADALRRNLLSMAAFASRHPVRLRPHAKTHKSAHLAAEQLAHGAVGVCVQKVGEAEAVMNAPDVHGPDDVLVTNEVIEPAKLDRLMRLLLPTGGSRRGVARRVGLAVDSLEGVDQLAAAWARAARPGGLEVLVEIDVGQGRCGVAPADAGVLARRLVDAGLPWGGLQAYHGGAQHRRRRDERLDAVRDAAAAVASARRALADQRLGVHASPVVERERWLWMPRAAPGTNFKPAPTCSWTATTPTTKAQTATLALNTPCS
jgi:D-threonine aldolase